MPSTQQNPTLPKQSKRFHFPTSPLSQSPAPLPPLHALQPIAEPISPTAPLSPLCAMGVESVLGFDCGGGEEGGAVDCGDDPVVMGISPLQPDECLEELVEREMEHLPAAGYAKRLESGVMGLSARRNAVDWIFKVHAYYNFGPLSAYLSVNYLDRFLALKELPQSEAWMAQLLSVACLSLAAKIEETTAPLPLDLQVGEAMYVFEAKTIQRVELLVLHTLGWRMQAVTPFSFIDHFLHKFNDGSSPSKQLLSRSTELVLNAIRGTDFLEFRPSEIAAAVALTAMQETKLVETGKAVTSCIHLDKERFLRCYGLVQEVALMKSKHPKIASPSAFSLPQSPNGVLDAACLSCTSDDITAGLHADSHYRFQDAKRMKLSIS